MADVADTMRAACTPPRWPEAAAPTPRARTSARCSSAAAAPTPVQAALRAYAAAREARGLTSQAVSHGEGARAAAAAAAAASRGAARKPSRGGAVSVLDFFQTEAKVQSSGARVRSSRTAERAPRKARGAAPRQLRFEADAGDDAAASAAAAAAGAAPRVEVSVREADTGAAVVVQLRLARDDDGADALASLLAAVSLGPDQQPPGARGAASGGSRCCSPDAACSSVRGGGARARLARLGVAPLSDVAQRASYLGFCAPLLAHMRARGLRTMSTAAVRGWLGRCADGDTLQRLLRAHGAATFAELQIDHIAAVKWGGVVRAALCGARVVRRAPRWRSRARWRGSRCGRVPRSRPWQDHPFNYFVMPRSLNASFNSDGAPRLRCARARGVAHHLSDPLTRCLRAPHAARAVTDEKVEAYMGRRVAKVVKGFCAWARAEAARCVDYSAFADRLVDFIV
jgi:hypothetical protein